MAPGKAACPSCEAHFPVTDGILDLRTGASYVHSLPLSSPDLVAATNAIKERPWLEVFDYLIGHATDTGALLDLVANDSLCAWRVFLGSKPDGRLLELGCQLGSSTKGLAPGFSQTVAVSHDPQSALFTHRRMQVSAADSEILVTVADEEGKLPFVDGSFDCIVASNQPEFLRPAPQAQAQATTPGAKADRWLAEQQIDRLRDLYRLLAADGELFLRCDNLLDLQALIPDGSLQSRPGTRQSTTGALLDLLLRRADFGHHLHTLRGYRALLTLAGFTDIELIALYRDDNQSEELRPLTAGLPELQDFAVGGLKSRIKKSPYLAPEFGLLARKSPSKRPGTIDRIIQDLADCVDGDSGSFTAFSYIASTKGKLITHARCNETELYMRLPLNSQAEQAELTNHKRLTWLAANRPALVDIFPQTLAHGSASNQLYFAESAVHGKPLIELIKARKSPTECLRIGLDFLFELNPPTGYPATTLPAADYQRLVVEPVRALGALTETAEVDGLLAFFAKKLQGSLIPLGLMHGDYGARNILTNGERVSGLLDWEESDASGIPALDAICLVFSCFSRLGDNFRGTESLLDMASRSRDFTRFLPALDAYYDTVGVSAEDHEVLVLLYWIHVVAHRIALGRTAPNTDYGRMIQRMIGAVLSPSAR